MQKCYWELQARVHRRGRMGLMGWELRAWPPGNLPRRWQRVPLEQLSEPQPAKVAQPPTLKSHVLLRLRLRVDHGLPE